MHFSTRRWWLLALASAPVILGMTSQAFVVRLENDSLRVGAPNLHFLKGKPLQRLHDGATVSYLGSLSILTGEFGPVESTSFARFAISHDVFEEMNAGFEVTLVAPGRQDRPSAKRLSDLAAEAWCLDHLKIDLAHLPANRPFWVRFEMTSEDPKDTASIIDPSGIILSKMVELFSQTKRDEQVHLSEKIGPVKLEDLLKSHL